MPGDISRWWLVLKEVRRQAARHLQAAGLKELEGDGVWYDVKESMNIPSDLEPVADSGRWQQLQWQNAFQVLVRRAVVFVWALLSKILCAIAGCAIAVLLTSGFFRSASFFERPELHASAHSTDDLLFFVLADPFTQDSKEPFLVRRKGDKLPRELDIGGELSEKVDWYKTTLLNLVIQTPYLLTVTSCRREDMKEFDALDPASTLPTQALRVAKHVYASPMRMAVNVDNTRAAVNAPSTSYPNICFAVDNFEDAFNYMVLHEAGWTYAVFLSAPSLTSLLGDHPLASNADGDLEPLVPRTPGDTQSEDASVEGVINPERAHANNTEGIQHPLAQPGPSTSDQHGSTPSHAGEPAPISGEREEEDVLEGLAKRLKELGIESNPKHGRRPKRAARNAQEPIELFSGFVTFEQLQQVTADRRRLRDMTPQLVRMRGPGGQGVADVAVTCLVPQGTENAESKVNEQNDRGRTTSRGTFAKRVLKSTVGAAAVAAKAIATEAYDAFVGDSPSLDFKMRCALMSLSIPVDLLAARILQIPLSSP